MEFLLFALPHDSLSVLILPCTTITSVMNEESSWLGFEKFIVAWEVDEFN